MTITIILSIIFGGLVLALLIIMIGRGRQPRAIDIQQHYKDIDSTLLDNNKDLCQSFYAAAFQYRLLAGAQKYRHDVIQYFRFFYEFHNVALKWIDDIVARTYPDVPSVEFIKTVIASGRIGKIFTELAYAGGLPNIALSNATPLLAYASQQGIELWATTDSKPCLVLSRHHLVLNRATKQHDWVTARLNAEQALTRQPIQIDLCFPERQFDPSTQVARHHEIYATQNYQHFEAWLREYTSRTLNQTHTNFGIAVEHQYYVDEGISAGELIEDNPLHTATLERELRRLKRARVDWFMLKSAMRIVKEDSPLDAVIVSNGLGLVVVSENIETGCVTIGSDPGWMVVVSNRSKIIENACVRAERGKTSLSKLLKRQQFCKWPIYSLVVFTDPAVELKYSSNRNLPQCDVIQLRDLESWLATHHYRKDIVISAEDSQRLHKIMNTTRLQKTNSAEQTIAELSNG